MEHRGIGNYRNTVYINFALEKIHSNSVRYKTDY